MKKTEKDLIERWLTIAMKCMKSVWEKTGDLTPEEAICVAAMTNINALFRILDRVKTED